MAAPPDDNPVEVESEQAARRRIRNRALTIGVSVVPFGLSFGAVSVETHLSLLQVSFMSLVLFSGASQFALVSVLGGGGSYVSAVGTALLLGARNGLYAARINALLHPSGWRRLVMAETTIDESTAMAVSEGGYGSRGPSLLDNGHLCLCAVERVDSRRRIGRQCVWVACDNRA